MVVKRIRWNKLRHTSLWGLTEYYVLKVSSLIICNRMEDYLSCHHSHPYCLYGCPCCYNWLPKTPTYYESTKRDIYIQTWTGIMYNAIFLSIWFFSSPSATCNYVHTRPSILVMNRRLSDPTSCFVYTVTISKHLDLGWSLPFSIFCWLLCRHSPRVFRNKTNELYFPHFSVKCIRPWHKAHWNTFLKKRERVLFFL